MKNNILTALCVIVFLALIAAAAPGLGTKFSSLDTSSVDANVSLIGIKDTTGGYLNYRFTIDSITAYVTRAGVGQNISNAPLTWNGDYLQNVNYHTIRFKKINYLTFLDSSSSQAVINMNSSADIGISNLYLNSYNNTFGLFNNDQSMFFKVVQGGSTRSLSYKCGPNNSFSWGSTTGADAFTFLIGGTQMCIGDSVTKSFQVLHLTGIPGTPSIAAGTGAGTSPTINISPRSNDVSGYITLATGTAPASSSTVFTFTFSVPYAYAPETVMLIPANAVTAALTSTKVVYVDVGGTSTTAFIALSGATGLTGGTTYVWRYVIMQ